MKFTQFLAQNILLKESINMTQYRSVINNAILDSIDELIDTIPSYKKKIDPDFRNAAVQGDHKPLIKAITPLLTLSANVILRVNLADAINDNIKEIENHVMILFKPISASGTAEDFKITLSTTFIDKIVLTIIKTILQWLTRMNRKETNRFKLLFDINSDKLNERFDFTTIPIVYELVNIILHELTHLVQDTRQSHRGGETEYRSYLSNGSSFDAILQRMYSGDKLTDKEFQIYYSSPQEIAAHAHNIAGDIVKTVNRTFSAQDIQKAVADKVGRFFTDRSDPRVQKVYNRYLKLVYQQVMNYFNK